MNHALGTEEISAAARESMQQDEDIRIKVRDLTLRALQTRQLDVSGMREVVRAVGEGVSLGLEQRSGEVRHALSAALSGLDDALAKAAQATDLALRELVSRGREFSADELRHALDDLRITEQAFLDTLSDVADAAGSRVGREFKDVVEHARRAGTDTAASVRLTLGEFGNRLDSTLHAGKSSSREAAHVVRDRLAALASGILGGMADALRRKEDAGRGSQ